MAAKPHPVEVKLLKDEWNDALEHAAQMAERDVDWTQFGKKDLQQWEGGMDGVRDYRLGMRVGRAIAAAIRREKRE